MKVLLINSMPDCVKERPVLPLGLLSIATYLSENGHGVRIFDRAVDGSGMKRLIRSFSPDIVGVSVISSKSYADGIKVSKIVQGENIPVVWGGLTPSLIPELAMKSGYVDFVIIGEGEITLLALIDALTKKTPLCEIAGLAYIESGEIRINKEREPADLSRLPVIDFSFVDPRKYIVTNINSKRVLHTYSSKGCCCQCAYCYNPAFSKGVWRARPPEHFLSEIGYLLANFDVDSIYFIDDLLSPNKAHTMNFCREIVDSGLDFTWGCDMRVDTCTKEELRAMFEAGCRWIFFGIESGSEKMQERIKKRLNLEKAKQTIEYCAEIGITTTSSFIVGFPDETQEELKETVEYAQGLSTDVKIAFSFGPIPKSEVFENLLKSNKLTLPDSYEEFSRLKWFDSFGKNYSKVPTIDCKVITSFFMYSIITSKHNVNDSRKRIWITRLFQQATGLLRQGNMKSIILLFRAVQEFLEVLFYATMFPKIRKKYNLTYKTKTMK
jgi:anaerobic magnesium-protoporphyrin IX monomethyl ester cyclase